MEPDKPVTLTWDNGEGVVFKRTISLSDHYLFTIKHEIENKTGNPVSVRPYARIQRQELPACRGLVGVLRRHARRLQPDA